MEKHLVSINWEKETFLISLKIQNKKEIATKSCLKSLPFWQPMGIEVAKHLEGTCIGRLTYTNNVINSAQHSLRTEIQYRSCHIPDGAELWFPASVQLGMFGVTVHLEDRWLLGTLWFIRGGKTATTSCIHALKTYYLKQLFWSDKSLPSRDRDSILFFLLKSR